MRPTANNELTLASSRGQAIPILRLAVAKYQLVLELEEELAKPEVVAEVRAAIEAKSAKIRRQVEALSTLAANLERAQVVAPPSQGDLPRSDAVPPSGVELPRTDATPAPSRATAQPRPSGGFRAPVTVALLAISVAFFGLATALRFGLLR